MQLHRYQKILVAFAIQFLLLGIVFIPKLMTSLYGDVIYLQAQPVDPRDLIRGDYLIFEYPEINELSAGEDHYEIGERVYAVNEDGWVLSKTRRPGAINIKGVISEGPMAYKIRGVDYYKVSYDFTDYFIEKGTGNQQELFNKEVTARVIIGDDGNAVLDAIFVDGKKWP